MPEPATELTEEKATTLTPLRAGNRRDGLDLGRKQRTKNQFGAFAECRLGGGLGAGRRAAGILGDERNAGIARIDEGQFGRLLERGGDLLGLGVADKRKQQRNLAAASRDIGRPTDRR